jgi:hypothetical protein
MKEFGLSGVRTLGKIIKHQNLIGFVTIYLIAFGIVLGYGLSHFPVNDGVKEYDEMLLNIQSGWTHRLTLVNSCLVTTWLPAMIQRLTHVDSLFIFRLIPALFYPLMPAFVFIIARRYVNLRYAMIAASLVLLNSHFAFFPDIGRVGVALGFMAGMIWALLEKRMIWTLVFAVLTVFSHYGTSLVAIGVVGFVTVGYLVWNLKLLKQYLAVLCVLVAVTGAWHFGVASYSGKIMFQTVSQSAQVGQILPVNPNVLDIQTREPAVQAAFAINNSMSTPVIIEIAANWMVVILVSIGLYFILRDKVMDLQYKLFSLILYLLIVLTVAIPSLSTYYGGMRMFFTSLMALGVGFVLASRKVAQVIHVNPFILVFIVLFIYGLATTGLIYRPFGLEKTFPVMETII